MKIRDLFERDIHRSINGVVKANQLDQSSVWQELDEFVVTRELTKHIQDLVEVLLSTLDSPQDASGKNGIWISGFFGSGKSHLLKVMSYLLENEEHSSNGDTKRAIDFFDYKLPDAMLLGDLKRVVAAPTDTILFNVDTKADHKGGRDTLLQVFLRVLNEKQGYSGDHPHIAHLERHLDDKCKLQDFHDAYLRESGNAWIKERDAWEFHRDEVVAALKDVLGQSEDSIDKWIDGAESNFSLTIENFAKWVKQYLDSRGPDQRLMFLVDEVGQFIGNDTHLMLNLQTITEQLGTVCAGRAWVVVTSQEDLDSVLGDLKNVKQHDFSKITGRFKTRLSLSSANVDEVIKKRLLQKRTESRPALESAYRGKEDILKHQLSFTKATAALKPFADVEDFIAGYPFAAYQFYLVQKVFESIRKAGATGLHLSQGERSTLDAFQNAAKQCGDEEVGALVPFHSFYAAVEGFLDTGVKRTISQAAEQNHMLEDFDIVLLKLLFLIRYVEELPGNVDNLITLCIDEIDTDRLALRKQIEASLARLESQTLIARNGDLYLFLTNEERDIGREIKSQQIASGSEAREVGKMIFEEILGDNRKHTYSVTGRDFTYSRICDDHPVGHKIDGSLEVVFSTPVGDSYPELASDAACIMATGQTGRVLIRLPDDPRLRKELVEYLKTDAYVKGKDTATLPSTTKRILRERTEENRARRGRIVLILKEMLADASFFAHGQPLDIQRTEPKAAVADALEYLIRNAYPKMSYIRSPHPNAKAEIQSILRSNDVEKLALDLESADSNKEALDDLREYIKLSDQVSRQIVLNELIEKRYGGMPYGWLEDELVLLVARLAVLKEIELHVDSAPLPMEKAYDFLTASAKQRKVVIVLRESADTGLIKKAQALGKELFAQACPGSEDGLYSTLREKLRMWSDDLASYEPLAKTGNYPGAEEIQSGLATLRKFVEETQSLQFLKRFVERAGDLRDLAEDVHELQGFYKNQKHSWEQLRAAVDELAQNRLQLEVDPTAGPALKQMEEILAMPRPYARLHEVAGLSSTARQVNDRLIAEAREPALAEIAQHRNALQAESGSAGVDGEVIATALRQFDKLTHTATTTASIAHIAQARQQAETAYDHGLAAIEEAQAQPTTTGTTDAPSQSTQTAPKKRRVVQVKQLWTGGMLETPEDIEAFLSTLRGALESALEDGERIQLK